MSGYLSGYVSSSYGFITGVSISRVRKQGQQLDIYGPARAVKGLSNGKTRFGTDAVIYPASW
jgi:hypothetical protein